MATRWGDAETGSDPVGSCDEVVCLLMPVGGLLTQLVGLRVFLGAFVRPFLWIGRRGFWHLVLAVVVSGHRSILL